MTTHAILSNSGEENDGRHSDHNVTASCEYTHWPNAVGTIVNRALKSLVRAKKRFVPALRLESFPFYVLLKRWLFSKLRQTEVVAHGFRLKLDPLDSLELSIFQDYEPFETDLLRQEISPGQTVVDIGANIGYYALLFSKLVGDTGQVFAFEPEPSNYEILRENIIRNDRHNVTPFNLAASDVTGKSFLYLSTDNYGDHQAYPSSESRKKIQIEVVCIDDLGLPPVDVVKIDVQGFEFRALKGMEQTLRSNRALIVFTEFWPQGLQRAGASAEEFLDFLCSLGFDIFYINEYANKLELAQDRHLLRRYTVEAGSHTNLLCRRARS